MTRGRTCFTWYRRLYRLSQCYISAFKECHSPLVRVSAVLGKCICRIPKKIRVNQESRLASDLFRYLSDLHGDWIWIHRSDISKFYGQSRTGSLPVTKDLSVAKAGTFLTVCCSMSTLRSKCVKWFRWKKRTNSSTAGFWHYTLDWKHGLNFIRIANLLSSNLNITRWSLSHICGKTYREITEC